MKKALLKLVFSLAFVVPFFAISEESCPIDDVLDNFGTHGGCDFPLGEVHIEYSGGPTGFRYIVTRDVYATAIAVVGALGGTVQGSWCYVTGQPNTYYAYSLLADQDYECEGGPDCSTTLDQVITVHQTLDMFDGVAPVFWSSPPEFFESNGCQYALQATEGCTQYLGNPATQCEFTVVGTGEEATGTDQATDAEFSGPMPDNLPQGCGRDSEGVVVCVDGDDPDDCGTYNGQTVCGAPEPNCAKINGTYICADSPQNCTVSASGHRVCVQPSDGSPPEEQNSPPSGCIIQDGQVVCFNDTARDVSETTVVTNPDGSTTTTTTTYNNHNGTTTTSTTTTQPDGSSTTVTDTSGSGQETPPTEEEEETEEEPEPYDPTGDVDAVESAEAQARSAYTDEMSNYANQFDSIPNSAIADWLPAFPTGGCSGSITETIFGKTFHLDPCEKLAPLREVFAWMFYLFTVFAAFKIVFKGHR